MDGYINDIISGTADESILLQSDTEEEVNIKKLFLHVVLKQILDYKNLQDVCQYIQTHCDTDEYRKYIPFADFLSDKNEKTYVPENPECATWRDYVEMLDFENINSKKIGPSARSWVPEHLVFDKNTIVTYV